MAPLPHILVARYRSHHYGGGGGGSDGGGIGGGVVAAIIALMVIIFLCVYTHEYSKAKRIRTETGAPIKHTKCIKKALLIAITFGFVSCLCAECCGMNDSNNGDVGGGDAGGAPQMGQSDGGFIQQPMPAYQQQNMDWTPVQNAAADPVL